MFFAGLESAGLLGAPVDGEAVFDDALDQRPGEKIRDALEDAKK